MPIKKEQIKAIATFTNIADEELQKIVDLSVQSEKIEIGLVTKNLQDGYDKDILDITGRKKPGGMKTFDHFKSILTEYKGLAEAGEGVEALNLKITTLEKEKSDLIKSGATDEAMKTQLADVQQKLNDAESKMIRIEKKHEAEKVELNNSLQTEKSKTKRNDILQGINSSLATSKKDFKKTIGQELLDETLDNRKKAFVKEHLDKADYISNGSGGQTLVYRDENGEIRRNPDTLQPLTSGDLFSPKVADLLDAGVKKKGAGTGKPGDQETITPVDISAAKTQVEADSLIADFIMERDGITKLDPSFADKQMEIRTEHKVADLPMQ